MKSEGTVIAVIIGAAVLLFWAASRGLFTSGVAIGGGIVAPQPSTNYSGYLAASTAPAVTGAINTALSGLSSSLASWLAPSPTAPIQFAPGSGPTGESNNPTPTLSAAPSGPVSTPITMLQATGTPVGPVVPPGLSYDATSGGAFDYSGLASDNSFDPSASLEV